MVGYHRYLCLRGASEWKPEKKPVVSRLSLAEACIWSRVVRSVNDWILFLEFYWQTSIGGAICLSFGRSLQMHEEHITAPNLSQPTPDTNLNDLQKGFSANQERLQYYKKKGLQSRSMTARHQPRKKLLPAL